MRYTIGLILILLSHSLAFSQTEASWIKEFFLPIPPPDSATKLSTDRLASTTPRWEWRPNVTLPAFKLLESSRENSNIDVFVLTSVGGGISYQKLKYDDKSKKWKSIFSWSPLTFLLAGNINDKNTSLDLSVATTLGFVNNLFMVGFGYDLGSVENRSRFFGLLSIGINFNN